MPTGYTASIKDGIDFKTFVMNCARAFGACVTIRDEPGGGDRIPEVFEPSDHHAMAVARARYDLAAIAAMTPAELEQAASNEWAVSEARRLSRLDDIHNQREAYKAMLNKVLAWVPPTPEHEGLRDFMQEQITTSISFDCDGGSYTTPIVRMTGEDWAASRRASLEKDVRYHENEHAKEVDRAANRTAWVRALRESL